MTSKGCEHTIEDTCANPQTRNIRREWGPHRTSGARDDILAPSRLRVVGQTEDFVLGEGGPAKELEGDKLHDEPG
jgi:hypothetical protein